MEPVTHILTGACLARAGLNRHAAYTTLAMAVAAELPDIDTLWSLRGPVVGFEHHRGITHTFLGIPFEAALVVAGVYLLHLWRLRRAEHPAAARPSAPSPGPRLARPLTAAPVRWRLLYTFTLLALLSHLWLDYTNNYGLRPFFPFNPRWYAASLTFIFDPAMFLLLLAALMLPPLFRLVGAEVGARRQPFTARGWAAAALLGVCGLWGWRAVEHSRATQVAMAQTYSLPASPESEPPCLPNADGSCPPLPAAAPTLLQAQRSLSSPDPINPFRWYSVVDFGPLYQLATVDLRADTYTPQQASERKLNPTPELLAAERTLLGRVYLDWSPMPFLGVLRADRDLHWLQTSGDEQEEADPADPTSTLVTLRDPRFLGDMPWLHASGRAPLTGSVELDAQGHVLRQRMDGKLQH